ncbi:MAG: T9SS type A sorting domain-containing protein [Candidatus Marinimicrobia bacterium]|nr:T9SS type A sorting domain-containing protein [Candidatus Neomarinimicrobiota bacterium]
MNKLLLFALIVSILIGSEPKEPKNYVELPEYPSSASRIGDYPYPTNPMNDRAHGYLLQGKVKNAIGNHGNYIDWAVHPAGLWGDYTYLPAVGFVAGVPGQVYSSKFLWEEIQENTGPNNSIIKIFGSEDAYDAWFVGSDTTFVGIVFEYENDRGITGTQVASMTEIDDMYQWGVDNGNGIIYLGVVFSESGMKDPNKSASRIGLMYPWGFRPALKERADEFDMYDYGPDREEWTADDNYVFYGATAQESWFTRLDPSVNSDWQASTKAREFTHNTEVSASDIFGETIFVESDDPYPLLAHSNYSQTWPVRFNEVSGLDEPFWPGWWAEDFLGENPEEWPVGCNGDRADPDCWEQVPGRFISDTDVYLEFDDRWAHRGNLVNTTNTEYLQTGYPLGLRVMSAAHSYGVAYAEDIMFVTVRVRNESGDWVDEDGVFHDAMIMPDGTKLNRGKGFDYKGVSLGFYMDADVLTADIYGNFGGVHTNPDDFMRYYDCLTDTTEPCAEVNGQILRVSMAIIEDKDGVSGRVRNMGMVATQLLDSPLATTEIDLNLDGIIDIYPGEKLKMTDWHWFDWYNRPGVVNGESDGNCCAGDPGKPQALNKEEILLKVITGDTTNLTENEKAWHFHTPDEESDLDMNLNPHFDSLEGLEDFAPDGLDCVLIMSSGPFDFPVGKEVPFSFCVIFGQNEEDLKANAKFAQIMYNSHYQGYTPPSKPNVLARVSSGKVSLYWDDAAEKSKDVVTGYTDFEGYKIYKSTDQGSTWGFPDKRVFDNKNIMVGWRSVAQFDLSAEEDSLHCIYDYNECISGENRGRNISGPDSHAPWFSLGTDTGFEAIRFDTTINGESYQYRWEDTNVADGYAYTYSVTGYDMGVEADYTVTWNQVNDTTGTTHFDPDTVWSFSNPDHWSSPYGYASIENSKGTTILDPNFVTVYPGPYPQNDLSKVKVVPNPYIVHSRMNETEVVRKIRFTHLPESATIKIYTVNGEYVNTVKHNDPTLGAVFWNLRTENNQEISPGLYIYVVESGDKKHVGKFAVVR